jgi:hypothetical protein
MRLRQVLIFAHEEHDPIPEVLVQVRLDAILDALGLLLPSTAIGESSRDAEIGILSPVLFKVVTTV